MGEEEKQRGIAGTSPMMKKMQKMGWAFNQDRRGRQVQKEVKVTARMSEVMKNHVISFQTKIHILYMSWCINIHTQLK